MRTHAALAGTLALLGCAGRVDGTSAPPPRDTRAVPALTSYVELAPGRQGCIYGDCERGVFARRTGDRVISGVAGERERMIEWQVRGCAWRYRGDAEDDLPHGAGTLRTIGGGPFLTIEGRFERGALMGRSRSRAKITDGTAVDLVGTFAFDDRCQLSLQDPHDVEIAALPIRITTPDGVQVRTTRFRGAVKIKVEGIAAIRGWVEAFDTTGYLVDKPDDGDAVRPAVCLSLACADGRGGELIDAGDGFELYLGGFARGLRGGPARVHRVEGGVVREYEVTYHDALISGDELAIQRTGYEIRAQPASRGDGRLEGEWDVIVRVGAADHLRALWLGGGGLRSGPITGRVGSVPFGAPAALHADLRSLAHLYRDLARPAPELQLTTLLITKADLVGYRTDGPRTPAIVKFGYGDGALRGVEQAWLPDTEQLYRGIDLALDGARDAAALTGTAELISAGGAPKPVALYRDLRVDPLGFATPADYLAASPATRAKRAAAWAKTAAARRIKDGELGILLRRIRDGIERELAGLADAHHALIPVSDDAPGAERVIHAGEAALDRASEGANDALLATRRALIRLADDDPLLPVLGALGAHLREHDARLRVLFAAFTAFEYSDDARRLDAIRRALATCIAAVPTAAITDYAQQLRDAMSGLPLPPLAPGIATTTTTPAAPPR